MDVSIERAAVLDLSANLMSRGVMKSRMMKYLSHRIAVLDQVALINRLGDPDYAHEKKELKKAIKEAEERSAITYKNYIDQVAHEESAKELALRQYKDGLTG